MCEEKLERHDMMLSVLNWKDGKPAKLFAIQRPDRKRPYLCLDTGSGSKVIGYFNDVASAELWNEFLILLVDRIKSDLMAAYVQGVANGSETT